LLIIFADAAAAATLSAFDSFSFSSIDYAFFGFIDDDFYHDFV